VTDTFRAFRAFEEGGRVQGRVVPMALDELSAGDGDRARRFTWLIDILYDHRVKLVASAAVPPDALYVEGPNARDFARTVSRLSEMRTRDYMALPHVTDGADAQAA